MARRHRAVVRVTSPAGPPSNAVEQRLENTQVRLTKAQLDVARLSAERDELALRLWLDQSLPQAEITERLDRADRRAGGPGISYAATQKRLWRTANAG